MTLSIIQTIHRGVYGMSDDQLANERKAQSKLAAARQAMTDAILNVARSSSVMKVDYDAWAAFMHDELPDFQDWDEKISEARRG